MKARMPVNVKREMKHEIFRLVENEYNKVREKENQFNGSCIHCTKHWLESEVEE